MYTVSKSLIALAFGSFLIACTPAKLSAQKPSPDAVPSTPWHLMLSHDRDGNVTEGSVANVVNTVRNGCQHRIAWGGAGRRTVEHVADIKWITVHNDNELKAQIGDFLFNQEFLGEDFPRAEPFGGTDEVVQWRATLKPDGSFNAIWYKPHSGALVTRRPQKYPMKWFADCNPVEAKPLYPEREDEATSTETITFSDGNMPVLFWGNNIPSGRPGKIHPSPFVLWMQTGTNNVCYTSLSETGFPGDKSRFLQHLNESIEVGQCPNLPGRCFLISEKWTKLPSGKRLNEAEACNPSLSEKDKKSNF